MNAGFTCTAWLEISALGGSDPPVRFALAADSQVPDGYSVKYQPFGGIFSHPPLYLYNGGEFVPVSFSLHVGVDKNALVSTPTELIHLVERLTRLALPSSGYLTNWLSAPIVRVRISDWWSRIGHLSEVAPTWMGPWDEEGRPMQVRINVTFITDFLANQGMNRDITSLPTSQSFRYSGLRRYTAD